MLSLAYEQFLRAEKYRSFIAGCDDEVDFFRKAYRQAKIPELDRAKTLKEIIGWALAVVWSLKPKVSWAPPEDVGQFELSLGDDPRQAQAQIEDKLSVVSPHVDAVVGALENLLTAADLTLWLMIDRLDELFARRSKAEQRALRGLLRTLRLFRSHRLRVKVFLRDDILDQIVSGEGFTALSHVAARKSDTLRWSEEQILTMIVRRIFATSGIRKRFDVDTHLMNSSVEYQRQLFHRIFDDTVYRPPNQSATLRWIYNHTKDGRGVVTPRDVILLLTRACQKQRDLLRRDLQGDVDRLVYGAAIIYGLEELSKEKKSIYLEAEFPHKWPTIRRLIGGGTEYNEAAMRRIYGKKYKEVVEDLVSLGVVERSVRGGQQRFKVPFLYRAGLECRQRFVAA